jgi:hypothetical protein
MFVDFRDREPPPPWHPPAGPPPGPRLTPRQQRLLSRVIGLNLLLLLIAPIGGATIVSLILTWWS